MSSDFKSKMTKEQEEILRDIQQVSQPQFAAMAMKHKQSETCGDATDIEYSLNMTHSHASILHQQADYWKKRCLQAEKRESADKRIVSSPKTKYEQTNLRKRLSPT